MNETDIPHNKLQAWLGFLRAHSRLVGQLEAELAEAGEIPLSWYDVLVQLRHAQDGQLRLQDLGEWLALSTSGLSRRVTRMEEAGLVKREPCPDDRRGVFVVLTPEGEAAYQSAAPVHRRGVNKYFAGQITDDEAATMSSVFSRMMSELKTNEN